MTALTAVTVTPRLPAVASPARWALLALLALPAMGCGKSIGDPCTISTDCSLQGDRLCDTSQPEGYCTVFNCGGNSCPDETVCVLFNPQVAGCGYTDRSVSRTARSFCLGPCKSDEDCREGYACRDPRDEPWYAFVLDDQQSRRVCLVAPGAGAVPVPPPSSSATAGVCGGPTR